MNFVPLIYQPNKCATHRYHIVIRVRAKNNYFLWKWFCTLWAVGVVCVWLASRPTSDGVLQLVEHLNICLVRGAKFRQDVPHPMLHVIMIGQF